ncbi:MAG: aminotransferase class I/II-fold pyridoxal phosphate-dependent enzyme [Lachnospiraceae bacterium]
MDFFKHGGDIYRNDIKLDFSSNISMLGIPSRVTQAMQSAIAKTIAYPDETCSALKQAIASSFHVEAEHVFCGNGASEVIYATIRAVAPTKAMVLAPTFSEYERAFRSISCQMCYYDLKKELEFELDDEILERIKGEEGLEMLVLCNPNNPTGAVINAELLDRILAICSEKNIFCMVDECFLSFTKVYFEKTLLAKYAQYGNLLVLHAFTKMYAIPGVRLGFGVCSNRTLLEKMEYQVPCWSVSTIAQAAGVIACDEIEYVEQVKCLTYKEQDYLVDALKPFVKKLYTPTANYMLFEDFLGLDKSLQEKGILIRNCSNYRGLCEGFYRIAIRSHEENEELVSCMREVHVGG